MSSSERCSTASCYAGARWWPPAKRVLWRLKAVTVAVSTTASVLMMIPAAAWQRQVSAVMGMEGPATLGLLLRTLIIALVVGGVLVGCPARVLIDAIRAMARYFIRRWHVNDEVALFIGTAVVVVLVITLINGVLFRGFLAGASRGVPAAEHHHPGRRRRSRWHPKDPAAQRLSRRGTRWGIRAATSSRPARTPRN